jgi:hypothetical protein
MHAYAVHASNQHSLAFSHAFYCNRRANLLFLFAHLSAVDAAYASARLASHPVACLCDVNCSKTRRLENYRGFSRNRVTSLFPLSWFWRVRSLESVEELPLRDWHDGLLRVLRRGVVSLGGNVVSCGGLIRKAEGPARLRVAWRGLGGAGYGFYRMHACLCVAYTVCL